MSPHRTCDLLCGEGLAEMAAWLLAVSGAAGSSQIYVAIEVPHGAVMETLIERDFTCT